METGGNPPMDPKMVAREVQKGKSPHRGRSCGNCIAVPRTSLRVTIKYSEHVLHESVLLLLPPVFHPPKTASRICFRLTANALVA